MDPSSLLLGKLRSALTKTGLFLRLISLASCCIVFFLVGALDASERNEVKLHLHVQVLAARNASMAFSEVYLWSVAHNDV